VHAALLLKHFAVLTFILIFLDMETNTKRATVYLDTNLHRALKIKAAQIDRTISDLINEAVRTLLSEDLEDLTAIEDRKDEPNLDFSTVLKELKVSGKI
jgi:hypothetical protein